MNTTRTRNCRQAARTRWSKSLQTRLDTAQLRARTIRQQERNITEDITDMSNFLGLVGIIALLLGGVGVASGVNAWVMRKIDTVAILRCLGATTRQVMTIYLTQAMVMGFLGAAIGAALGIVIQFLLPGVLSDVLPVDVTVRLEPRAIAMGMLLGLWIAFAFALRPLIALQACLAAPGAAAFRRRIPADGSGGETRRVSW